MLLALGICAAFTLIGGYIGARTSHSSSIMLSQLDGVVDAVAGAAIGFALGVVFLLAGYVANKLSR